MNAPLNLTELHQAARAYAKQISIKPISEGYQSLALHTYTDSEGLPIYWKARLKHPDTGDKRIMPFSHTDAGFQFKEPDFSIIYSIGKGKKPLYRLHELSSDPESMVFIVEGELTSDTLLALGVTATTSGGSNSVDRTDWQPLAGRTVRIWRDNDDAGTKYQNDIKNTLKLLGCNVSCIAVDTLGLPVKGDVVDWLAMRTDQGLETTENDVLSLPLILDFKNVNDVTEETENNACEPTENTHETEEAALKRLASLSMYEYELCRTSEAKRLGNLRPSVLDKLIKPYKVDESSKVSGSNMFEVVELWDDPVDGVALLDEIASIVNRHIVCEKPTVTAASLWITFSWCIDVMHVSPIACITAPEKRCGKTQLLNLIGMLCMKPLPASNITSAALFRSIEAFEPTLLIDEADSFLGQNEELRGIINSGHTRQSAFVIRTVGDNFEPKRFSTWGAKAISGIGQLSETLKDRSILLELRRKKPNEHRDRLRHADTSQFERVKRKLARWSKDNAYVLKTARPELPDALNDRAQDNWESLLAIADCVGGHWAKTARHAALAISGIEEDAPSINEELLYDIKQVFESMRVTRIASVDLLERLCRDEEAPWATWTHGKPMTPRKLSQRLSEFGITSKTMRDGSGTFKGYELSDFNDAFNRYLKFASDNVTKETVTRLQPSICKPYSQNSSVTQTSNVTDNKQLEPLQTEGCDRVTDRSTISPETNRNSSTRTDNQGSLYI